MPRPHCVPRPHIASPARERHRRRSGAFVAPLLGLLALLLMLAFPSAIAHAAPEIWLPTPPGETWKIIQGYGCGTHSGWDRYSLDLVNADGRTRGAPVRAAADGRIWSWTGKSGTLILDHGDGLYTMYTHMDSAVTTERDKFVARGTVIGIVGARAAHGLAHLHFTAFTGVGQAASQRRSIPLSFADGYDLPEVGGCSQHGGEALVARGQFSAATAGVRFSSAAELGRWYNSDMRIEFAGAGAGGFSQAWDQDPGGDAPQFAGATTGFMQLAWPGEGLHTLYVRDWDAKGNQTLTTYGPIGYDLTPPSPPAPIESIALAAGAAQTLSWSAAADAGSGVAGYRVYIGAEAAGVSDWFTPDPEIETPALAPGSYVLRVQPLDYAGNAGAWATIGEISVKG